MGNKLQARDAISYKSKSGLVFEIQVNDLQGGKKFPKPPKREDIILKYNQWLSEVYLKNIFKVTLEESDIKLLQTVESKYKFRICYVHEQIMEKINMQKKQEFQTNQIYIDQLKKSIIRLYEDYNDVDLSSISKGLSNSGCIDQKLELIKNMNFISYLADRLILLEETSRITNNFRDQIRILELHQVILNTYNINHKSLFHEPKCFKSIIQNFHPLEPKVTGLVFKIIAGQNGLSWKDNNFQNIQDALKNLQDLYAFQNKFQIFLRTMYYTKNLIMIYQIIKFLFRYLYSLDDKNQLQVATELYTTKVNDKQLDDVFKQIKLRIKLDLYKKEDCTYEAVRNILTTFEHPLISYNQDAPRLTKQFASFVDAVVDDKTNYESDYDSSQNIQDINFLQDQYFYYEEGQEHVFKALKQSVIEWIDAIQNISLLSLKEDEVDQFFLENEKTSHYAFIGEKDINSTNSVLSKTTKDDRFEQEDQNLEQKNYKSKYKEAKEIINELRNQLDQQTTQHNVKLQDLSLQNQKLNDENSQTIQKLQEQMNQLQKEIQNYKILVQEDEKSIQVQLNQSNIPMIQQKDSQTQNTLDSQKQQTGISSNITTKIQPPPLPPPLPPIQQAEASLPPPPPPPPIQTTGGPPLPPPLRSNNQQLQQLLRKQQPVPSKPMKPLFWTAIPDSKAFKTIFEKIQNDEIKDTQFLEMNFCKPHEIQRKTDNSVEVNVIKQKIKLLQPERSQNIEIILSKLRLNINSFSDSLLQINLKVLTENVINSLIAICPSQEEIELLNDFTGDKSLLGQSDLFIDALRKINGFQFRIKALHFMYNYHENKSTFLKDTMQLTQAFINLKNSQEIQTIILIVLRLGNFLNAKTPKGNIAAFKLEAIEKCSDLKSIDNQQNLLYYVIEKSEQILNKDFINQYIITQFEIIEKISLSQLQQSLNDIKKGQNLIVQSIESASDNPKDLVAIQFQPILTEIQQDFVQFQLEFSKVDKHYKECCEFYCENQSEQSDKFGEKIMKILRCLYKNKQEKLIKLEKLKKAEEQKLKSQQSQQNEKPIARNDRVNKTWMPQNQQNQGQTGFKKGRESLVDKEIKEMYKLKNQSKFIN